jgi:hypothetical protein
MSDTTSRLGLPLIAAAQAQKHVPVNEAMARLDLIVQASVLTMGQNVPPELPLNGESHLVGSEPSGAWADVAHHLAIYEAGGWRFAAPFEGFRCWVAAEGGLCVFRGGAWTGVAGGHTGEAQNLTLFGFGTEADADAPFAVKAERALFTAISAEEGGTGDLRYLMNKSSEAAVLSLLMQSGYGGRAELGLVGDDDFAVKISEDGVIWREAIKIDRTSGRVRFPSGGVREQFASDRGFYVRSDGSDLNTGEQDSAGGAFATLQGAYESIVRRFDFAGHTAVVHVSSGSHAGLSLGSGWVGGGTILVQGAERAATVIAGAGHLIQWSKALGGAVTLQGVRLTSTGSGDALRGEAAGEISFGDIDFGPCGGRHVAMLAAGATAVAIGDYAISGGAARHWFADASGRIAVQNRAVGLSGNPVFGCFAEASACGVIQAGGGSFAGNAAGPRYAAVANGVIRTGGGPAYLPGNTAGSATSGGQYI